MQAAANGNFYEIDTIRKSSDVNLLVELVGATREQWLHQLSAQHVRYYKMHIDVLCKKSPYSEYPCTRIGK